MHPAPGTARETSTTGKNGERELDEQEFFVLPALDEMGRRKKTLLERVLENSFRPGRYGHLLDSEPLPASSPFPERRQRLIWERLRAVQEDYRTATGNQHRRAEWYRELHAETFSSYVCALHGSELPSWYPPLGQKEQQARAQEAPPCADGPAEYVCSVQLRCEECGQESEYEAAGWVALLGDDPRYDLPEAFVFCPDCARTEFELRAERS